MAQVIDMKRLHMGCGESLQRVDPFAFKLKGRASQVKADTGRETQVTRDSNKHQRRENS